MVYHVLMVKCTNGHPMGVGVPYHVPAVADVEGYDNVPLIVPGDPAFMAGHDAAPAALQGEYIYVFKNCIFLFLFQGLNM